MKDNVIVIMYCGNGEVDKAFEYLLMLYLSNYRSGNVYGVVLDLPPSVCYNTAGDGEIAEKSERYVSTYTKRYGRSFFCAIRPRRYHVGSKKFPYAYFSCDDGETGALNDVKSFISGNKEVFSSYYGNENFGDCGMIYLTAYGVLTGHGTLDNYLFFKNKKHITPHMVMLPPPGGIDILRRQFIENGARRAVLPICEKENGAQSRDGMYPADADDFNNREDNIACREVKLECCKESYFVNPGTQNARVNRAAIKRAAGCAADCFLELYRRESTGLFSADEIVYALCGAVAMRLFGFFGPEETLALSDTLLERFRFITSTEELEGSDGQSAVCLTALAGAYLNLAKELPEFYFLNKDASKLVELLLPRTMYSCMAGNTAAGIAGALCYKELNVVAGVFDKLPEMLKIILFGDSENAFWSFIKGKIGSKDVYTNSCIMIRAAQLYFDAPFSGFLRMSEIYRAKSSNLGKLYTMKTSRSYRKSSVTERLVTSVETKSGLRPVRERFMLSGCDTELLQYAAYLDRCACGSPDGSKKKATKDCVNKDKKLICFSADEPYTLLLNILRAARSVNGIKLTVITKDRYSHKKLRSANGEVTTVTKDEKELCRQAREKAFYFRQITPFTTLSELMRSV